MSGADNLKVVTMPSGSQVTRPCEVVKRLDTVFDSVGAILDLSHNANEGAKRGADYPLAGLSKLGILCCSPPLRDDWWAMMPGTVMARDS
jgi:hypothetical protein